MCVVSMIGDHYRERLPENYPWIMPKINPAPYIPYPFPKEKPKKIPWQDQDFPDEKRPTQKDIDDLRKEIDNLKKLLKKAKKYDEDNYEPNCEIDEKMDFLRKCAELVGISLDDVIGKGK